MPRFFSCALLVLACGACQLLVPEPVIIRGAPDGPEVTLTQGTLRYQGNVEPLPLNDYCSIQFIAEGTELLALEFDADMPAHKHGMITKPEITWSEDDGWWVHGMIFHMPGAWVMSVNAQTTEGWYQIDFPVHIGPR